MFFKERRERERENKQTYLLCFLKKRERKREEEEEGREGHQRGTSCPLETAPGYLALVIYKILEKTLILLGGINTLLDKCILFGLLISTLCQKALKVCIDLINN